MLDDFIIAKVRERQMAGLSLAIIEDHKIVKAQGYGVAEKDGKMVTPATLFQAGSISKALSAVGALKLVEQGALSLDADVNTYLQGWRLPQNDFTREEKVTLRRILSHSAGLTVHGFPGYRADVLIPKLVEVLDGAGHSNTAAIRADTVPGTKSRYSGGGFMVVQQMIIDVTGKSFPEFMREAVLKPCGMTGSTFEQPLPKSLSGLAATGYEAGGKPILGGWHIYPEMAAAGL